MSFTNEQKLAILLQEIDDGNLDYENVITNLYEANIKLKEVCEEAFTYLDNPVKSRMGNTEIINMLHKSIEG